MVLAVLVRMRIGRRLTNAAMEKRQEAPISRGVITSFVFFTARRPTFFYRITVFLLLSPCLFPPTPSTPILPYKMRNLPFYFSLSSSRVFFCEKGEGRSRGRGQHPSTYSPCLPSYHPLTSSIPLLHSYIFPPNIPPLHSTT